MARPPVTFLHASNLDLDAPLAGLGPLPPALRTLVRDASLTAWDGLVAAALARSVDFLIITGHTLHQRPLSSAATEALVRGLEKLAAEGIPVFLQGADPERERVEQPWLPDNATFVDGSHPGDIEVERDGQLIATLHRQTAQSLAAELHGDQPQGHSPLPHSDAVRIALVSGELSHAVPRTSEEDPQDWSSAGGARSSLPLDLAWRERAVCSPSASRFDYWALAGPARSLRIGSALAHSPGSPQGLTPHDSGPHGCDLVEIHPHRAVAVTPLTLAPVRWQSLDVDLTDCTNAADLLSSLSLALEGVAPAPHAAERLWLLSWQLRGTDRHCDGEDRDLDSAVSLCAELTEHPGMARLACWTHHAECRARDARENHAAGLSDLAAGFLRAVEDRRRAGATDAVSTPSSAAGTEWETRLAELLTGLDRAAIEREAIRRGVASLTELRRTA